MTLHTRAFALVVAILLAAGLGACTTGPYGPVYGPHRPVVVQPVPQPAPVPTPVRDTEPPARLPTSERDQSGFTLDTPTESWGVGYLTVRGAALETVQAPLYETPGGPIWGWMVEGRGYAINARRAAPLRPGARLRTPAGEALVVLETAPGGWAKLRWGAPSDPLGGVGWTDTGRWRGGAPRIVSWDEQVTGARGVTYRDRGTSYNLREGPGTSHGVIEVLTGDDYDLTVLALDGDWMRVRVHAPPACGPRRDVPDLLGGVSRQEREGWIYWRSARRGPWVRPFGADCGPGA